ncbi:MAG: type IX secretion system membrane protein PorP/SprF [Flavobacteriales bacterium]|nr:type IX secretion system membrane protein PorP/SprF [Flavobacteriales bacterium]
MNRLRILLAAVVIGLFAPMGARAQQDPLYSQYMFNTLAFNPAYAGSADVFTTLLLSRHQWVGFEGAPSTQTLSAHSPLPLSGLAMGGNIIHDRTGPARQTGAFIDLAYRIRTGDDTRLSFGLKGGMNMYQADVASLLTVDPDPSNVNVAGRFLPNFGFGLYWHGPRHYLGASAPKLLENEMVDASSGAMVVSQEARHYFLMGGYVMDAGQDLKFKPSFMLRLVEGAPLSLDLNANFLLRERIWLGAMYRVGNAFGLMAQFQLTDQFRAGYAFDATTTRIGAYNAGTHELMIGFDLNFSKGRTISPRYF